MTKYNGHRSWNAWNVSLWINNDESLYETALAFRKSNKTLNGAVNAFMHYFAGERTPDGAKYTRLAVKLALEDLV